MNGYLRTKHISGLIWNSRALSIGVPDRCVIYVLSQRKVLFIGNIFAGNMSLVDGMWALKGLSLCRTNSWWCLSEFRDSPERPCCSSETKPSLKPCQTGEATRFIEVKCQGLTWGFCLGSPAEAVLTVKPRPRKCAVRLGRRASLCVWESQAGNQSPELCEMPWSCKWRSVPLLSGTLPFAMVRAYLNCKCFWVHVPWAPREDRPVFPSHLAFCRIRQVGRWRLAVLATLVIPTWKRCLIMDDKENPGALWTYRNSQNHWCKILTLIQVLGSVSVTLVW